MALSSITNDRLCPHCGHGNFSGMYPPNIRNCNNCFMWLEDRGIRIINTPDDDGSEEVKD